MQPSTVHANVYPTEQFLKRRSAGIGEIRIQNRQPLDDSSVADLWEARRRFMAKRNRARRAAYDAHPHRPGPEAA